MKGFVAITRNEWIDYIKSKNFEEAVFWKKRLQFKALKEGEYFYFLNRASVNSNRYIIGKAVFGGFQTVQSDEAWKKFGQKLGSDKDEFDNLVNKICGSELSAIGCICLKNVKFASEPILLQNLSFDISPFTVSGKTISECECEELERSWK